MRAGYTGKCLLARRGDVHPPPGLLLRIAVANVTSLRAHLDTVLAWEVDVLLLSEMHLTATGQRVVAARAREAGWQPSRGAPLESRGRGVLVCQGHLAQQEKPRAVALAGDAVSELWHSARRCHVLVGLGTWADALHVHAIYGVPSRPELKLSERALEYMALNGAAPQVVGGDVNFLLGDLHQVPPGVLASLLAPSDADMEIAAAAGRAPLCSYLGPGMQQPSRIDGLLVGTRLAPLLQ